MEWVKDGDNKERCHLKMKGEKNTIQISGKMLRYTQDRLKMGFKRSDRDIVIFDLCTEETELFHNIAPKNAIIMDFRITEEVIIAACSHFEIDIINQETKEIINVIKTEGIVNSISLTPDCQFLACSIYTDINIYEFVDGFNFCFLHKKLVDLHKGNL